MKCKTEIVDGIKGEWRTVTKAEEVKVGQRVRYNGCEIGCYGEKRLIRKFEKGRVVTFDGEDADSGSCNVFRYPTVQAFFPIAKRQKRKVAKIDVFCCFNRWKWQFILPKTSTVESCRDYSTRTSAIRGARRFCKTIGFECEIVK
jgi:hypothetical protein